MATTRHPTAAQRERRAAANAALVRRLIEEACNRGEPAILDELLAAPTHAGPLDQRGRLPELLAAFRTAVPDARWAVLELVAEGDAVVARLEVRGSFSGPLVGLAPPGRPATLSGVAISRFAAGRLVGLWLQADLLGLLEQLAVLPPLGLAQAVTMARVLHAGALLAQDHAPPTGAARIGTPPIDGK